MTKREFVEVMALMTGGRVHEINKNGDKKIGVALPVSEEMEAAIYADDIFEDYSNGNITLDEAVTLVKEAVAEAEQPIINVKTIIDWDAAKYNIRPMLVFKEWQDISTMQISHLPDELALAFYYELPNQFGSNIRINQNLLDQWNVTIEDVARVAREEKPVLRNMLDMLLGDSKNLLEENDGNNATMLMLTNDDGFRGASVLTNIGVLRKIGEIVGGDYYILPSSLHEVIIVTEGNPDELKPIVRQINGDVVDREEWLSDNVYRFLREDGKVEVA